MSQASGDKFKIMICGLNYCLDIYIIDELIIKLLKNDGLFSLVLKVILLKESKK